MKKSTLKTLLTVSALSVASGYTVLAQAHCIGLGTSAAAQFQPSEIVNDSTNSMQYDTYTLICPAGTNKLVGRVSRTAGPAVGNITLKIARNTGTAVSAGVTDAGADSGMRCDATADFITDTGGVGDNVTSAFTTSAGGAGEYVLMVSKDDAGTSGTYNVEAHCQNTAGTLEFDPNKPSALPAIAIGWDRGFNN